MWLLRAFVLAAPLVGFFAVLAAPLSAQGGEPLLETPACRENPHSEECICANVHVYSLRPRFVDNTVYPPVATAADCVVTNGERVCTVASGRSITFNEDTLTWDPPNEESLQKDFVLVHNEKYKAYCSISYFRENLRRLWTFSLAFAGGLVAITVAWGGAVYMQEAVSGETRSTARAVITRSLLGLIILAAVFLIWEGVSGLFLSGYDIWRSEPGSLELFQERYGEGP